MKKSREVGVAVKGGDKAAPVKRRTRAKTSRVPSPSAKRLPVRPERVTVVPPIPMGMKNGRVVVLHRDVFWLGQQWAVTGYGIQAINIKLEMKFDIDVTRIWDDNLDADLLQEPWFIADDFAEALAFARRKSEERPTSFLIPSGNER